ncbi:MAG: DUF481 domain-containing protein [Planctomycetes bacterium]|nr:DUF481 domain-containing protein [Planctomycetota bacterium]
MRLLPVFVLGLAFALNACAEDIVTLKNGDKLSGTVVDLNGGKLKFKTAYAGEILIEWAQIQTLTTEGKHKLKLDDGQMVEGKITTTDKGTIRVEDEALKSPVEVDPVRVAKINETPTEWHGFVEVGYRQSSGNTHKQAGIAQAELLRETDRDRFLIKAIFRYGRSEKVTNERAAYGILKYNYKFTPVFYGYISEELFHDYFRDERIGTFTSVGVGFDILHKAPIHAWTGGEIDLSAEAGIAYATNDHYVGKDEGHLAGRVACHLRVALPLGLEFTNDATFYPNFEHSTDWQARDEAALSAGIGKGWTARVGAIWEYDHVPPAGFYRFDVLYFATLGYKF